ncbi:DUF4269 domain-containing protein [Bacteriovorax sp. Seq25_V]|uniref:DUF4269 domain-containing protein n=1 Tax=Bacteriovorax sp. Seq25_V TaxID=1201288 RepID=UPI00038A23C5|nr:DUF4269 domain-containing protein [Bacteriovorax sp. Seq25_V]EQC47900.1 PF14091 domain protein [Bacteriovorax sp. Seq25_V]
MKTLKDDFDKLKYGTKKQRLAYEVLRTSNIYEILAPYSPFLAGTIPLDIDVENSDLDIICEVHDFDKINKALKKSFGSATNFKTYTINVRGIETYLCNFRLNGFEFEIFCQGIPVLNQYAVIHYLVEKRILAIFGSRVKNEIRKYKNLGIKTELAFAKYFNIQGDPYDELAKLQSFSDEKLLNILKEP